MVVVLLGVVNLLLGVVILLLGVAIWLLGVLDRLLGVLARGVAGVMSIASYVSASLEMYLILEYCSILRFCDAFLKIWN